MKLLSRRLCAVGFGGSRHGEARQGKAGEQRVILLLDHRPPAHASIDQFGWTFWECRACHQLDHFNQPLSREQLSKYTRGHRLFCAEDADEAVPDAE